MAALRQQAEADKTSAIQDSMSRETRQLLLQFGRRKAFSGASMGATEWPGRLAIGREGILGMGRGM